jgi:hypothetical protein
MVVDRAKIERLEKELEEAKQELWKEDAERYRVLMRKMSEAERERILGSLTERGERVLFGLEAPEEPQKRAGMHPGGSGGDLECPYCGKKGLTKRGLGLHVSRMHKGERVREEAEAA